MNENRRSRESLYKIGFRVSTTITIALALAACKDLYDVNFDVEGAAGTQIAQAGENGSVKTETVQAKESPTLKEQAITPTPTQQEYQEYIDKFCGINPAQALLTEGLNPENRTVVALSQGGIEELIGSKYLDTERQNPNPEYNQEAEDGMVGQIAYELSLAVRDSKGIDRVVVTNPEGRLNDIIQGAKDFLTDNNLPDEIPFEVVGYEQGLDLDSGSTRLISVHGGENGWTTAQWENASLSQNPDGSFRISGTLYNVYERNNGSVKTEPVPAQRLYGGEPDFMIVNGCLPSIVQRSPDGKVFAVYVPDEDLNDDIDDIDTNRWKVATKEQLAQQEKKLAQQPAPTKTPEPTPYNGPMPSLLWGEDPAPLGLLQERFIEMFNVEISTASGVLLQKTMETVNISGHEYYLGRIKLLLGNDLEGNEIIKDFLFGDHTGKVFRTDMMGRSLPGDPNPASNTSQIQVYTDIEETLDGLIVGGQYAFHITSDDPNKFYNPGCTPSKSNYNVCKSVIEAHEIFAKQIRVNDDLIKFLSGENTDYKSDDVGWINTVIKPPLREQPADS